jgi:amphi-Trp domain-containing protein
MGRRRSATARRRTGTVPALPCRQEAARFITALAAGLGEDGQVTVRLGNSTLELSVADQVHWELEVEVDGDEIDLELELKWSTSGRSSAEAAEVESEEDESQEDESEEDESEDVQPEPVSELDGAEEPETGRDASAEEEAKDGESEEHAGSGEAESMQAAEPDRTSGPRRGRRSASAEAGKSAFNGVDTAAVRAWAAANGLTVSPRGRIKDEVIQAYRAAGKLTRRRRRADGLVVPLGVELRAGGAGSHRRTSHDTSHLSPM